MFCFGGILVNRKGSQRKMSTSLAWTILVAAGLMEAVWAVALQKSEGFSQLIPTLVFAGGLVLSILGLATALKSLPLGTCLCCVGRYRSCYYSGLQHAQRQRTSKYRPHSTDNRTYWVCYGAQTCGNRRRPKLKRDSHQAPVVRRSIS